MVTMKLKSNDVNHTKGHLSSGTDACRILELTKRKLVKEWKEPLIFGGYFLHQAEYEIKRHAVKFVSSCENKPAKLFEKILKSTIHQRRGSSLSSSDSEGYVSSSSQCFLNESTSEQVSSPVDSNDDSSNNQLFNRREQTKTSMLSDYGIDEKRFDTKSNFEEALITQIFEVEFDDDQELMDCQDSVGSSEFVRPNVRIEYQQFIRSPSDEDLELDKKVQTIINQRLSMAQELKPFKQLFEDLENIEQWDESLLVPEANQLDDSQIKQIKKGMVNGKLYNISLSSIKKVFHRLPYIWTQLTKSGVKFGVVEAYQCPLCSKQSTHGGSVEIYNHLEIDHSASLLTCIYCDYVVTNENDAIIHSRECLGNLK